MYSRTFVWLAASWWQRHTGSHYRSSPSNYRRAGDVKAVLSARRGGSDSSGEHLDISCELETLSDKETCRKSGELCSLQILGLFECNRQRQPPMEHTSAPLWPRDKLLANNSSQPLRLIELPRWWMVYLPLIGLFDENLPSTNGRKALYRINTFFQLCNLLWNVWRMTSTPASVLNSFVNYTYCKL